MVRINDRLFSVNRPRHAIKEKKIDLFEKVNTIDIKSGQMKGTWKRKASNLWAYYRQMTATESVISGSMNYLTTHMFVINYRDDVDVNMRIRYNGVMYDIKAIDLFEDRKQDLLILAERHHDVK
ncbi:phage head closure protein [Hutsoniella sourekii]|uniref:phage head closure protein n=1 Tax=Hutsoniella sourekii TaxID=87650 RepID=UPI000688737D|nr:phage head closure protein [Hutsoniella sourekii]